MRQLRQDKILRDVLGLGQGERGLARLGLVSLETVLAQLIEEPGNAWKRRLEISIYQRNQKVYSE